MALTIIELNNVWTSQYNLSGSGTVTLITTDENGFTKYSLGQIISRTNDTYRGILLSYPNNINAVFIGDRQPFDKKDLEVENFELKPGSKNNELEIAIHSQRFVSINPRISVTLVKDSKIYMGTRRAQILLFGEGGVTQFYSFSINSVGLLT